jgi:hypothetical protein
MALHGGNYSSALLLFKALSAFLVRQLATGGS